MLVVYTSWVCSSHFLTMMGICQEEQFWLASCIQQKLKHPLSLYWEEFWELWTHSLVCVLGGGSGMMKNIKDLGLINNVFSRTFPMLATPLIFVLPPDCMILSCWLFLQSKWSSQWQVLSRRMHSRVQGVQEKNGSLYFLFLENNQMDTINV